MKKTYMATRLMMLLTILSSSGLICSASEYTVQPQEAGETSRHVEQLKHESQNLRDETRALIAKNYELKTANDELKSITDRAVNHSIELKQNLEATKTLTIGLENRIKELQSENERLRAVMDKLNTQLSKCK